ncbi:MAG: sigma-70 family RNA polymerase sigma factor [Flavobacteriaceae bacterium]|nr:sigma-70 family RNA polymerase sigma factor [Flavobacteriaceae bacterium]
MVHGYSQNQHDKKQLIEENLELVKKIAFYYLGRVGKVVEIDDLLQLGMVGLVEAAHNYTPKENVNFEVYARLRIKGSIIDHLRRSSNLCRGTIKRKQDYERARRKLEAQFKREPTIEELSSELQVGISDLATWKFDFAANQHQSIEEANEAFGDFLFSLEPSVEEKIYNGQLREILRNNLSELNQQQLLVLQLYYVEELNVYEIAEVMAVTTGRVSQIKSAATTKLRELIERQLVGSKGP